MSSCFDPEAINEFARYYGFHYDNWDPLALVEDVLIDMERGLKGLSSSLPMIPSYITPVAQVPPGKTVLALDAGGTNLRASLVHFDAQGKAIAEGTTKTPMPGTRGKVNAEQFFDQIADAALPLLSNTSGIEGIGFTFSYPMEMTADADGILMAFSKEVDAPEVIGKAIGAGLREALARKGHKYSGPIALLNDTVATLLSGLAAIPIDGEAERTKNAYGFTGGPVIGFILGTGFNTAYPERSIPKIGFESAAAPQIVVCETGTFKLRYRGQLDQEYDNTTKNPGAYTLEKASAGAYLGPLTLHILKQAVKDKLIRFKKSEELLAMPHLETRTLNEFSHAPLAAEGPLGSLFGLDEGDALAAVQYITSIITERGALFSSAVLAATVARINACDGLGYEPYAPVRIAVEGTTYLIYKGMRRSLESWLHLMLYSRKPRPYIIAPVEQASLFGAAVAAMIKK
ncbi:hexokinase [Spirochaetia bacterium]|nr:hexokinase [Spirochaetia bacterium]